MAKRRNRVRRRKAYEADESHRFFGPSGAHRWTTCTASAVVDTSALTERRRPSAERGVDLHGVSEECLREGKRAPRRLEGDDLLAVNEYVDYVNSLPGEKLYEFRADLIPGLSGGTADSVAVYDEVLDPSEGGGPVTVLHVVDFKTGYQFVDADGNLQLAIYALAVKKELEVVGYSFDLVRLTIVQPARDYVGTWEPSLEELEEKGLFVLGKVDAIMAGEVEFLPTEKNCQFCDAKPICPAFSGLKGVAAADDFAEVGLEKGLESEVEAATEAELWGSRARLVPMLRAWCDAVEGEVRRRLLAGEKVDGFKAVAGRSGNRGWRDPEAAKRFLLAKGVPEKDLFSEPAFASPSKAEKALKALFPDKADRAIALEALAPLVAAGKVGPPTVVEDFDPRAAIDKAALARRDFGG